MTPGSLKIVATFVLPALFGLALVALPWIDRSKETAPGKRRLVVGLGSTLIAGIVGLTVLGIANRPSAEGPGPRDESYDAIAAGRATFERLNCATCHRIDGEGKEVGPDLSGVGLRFQESYLKAWLMNPTAYKPRTQMPAAEVNRNELEELVAYLQSLVDDPNLEP